MTETTETAADADAEEDADADQDEEEEDGHHDRHCRHDDHHRHNHYRHHDNWHTTRPPRSRPRRRSGPENLMTAFGAVPTTALELTDSPIVSIDQRC